jgi:hypothetical protein
MVAKHKVHVPLSAQTFSGGRLIDDINAGIEQVLADCVAGMNEKPQRTGARSITIKLKLEPNGEHTMRTSHKVDVAVPRPEVGDTAFVDGGEVFVDMRIDPGTTQLDIERVIRANAAAEKGA